MWGRSAAKGKKGLGVLRRLTLLLLVLVLRLVLVLVLEVMLVLLFWLELFGIVLCAVFFVDAYFL